MKSRLFIYDTSNFVDFPIGGQLTSIRNFLTYICQFQRDRVEDIVVVGVTTDAEKVGQLDEITICQQKIKYFPVAITEKDLGNTQNSLRAAYVKGLLKYGRQLKIRKRDCNYIHTPEAYGVVRVLSPLTACVIFSHGSYFNMLRGFRFFQNNPVVKIGFQTYLKLLLRTVNFIFVLDQDSQDAYVRYNKKVLRVNNSIVCPTLALEKKEIGKRLLFVGRLSKDKQVAPIMEAANQLGQDYSLTVVGNGEEYENLKAVCGGNVTMVGAVTPNQVKQYMEIADFLVMNSVFEGIPMAILEGMSYGLPIVSTNVGGIGDVVAFGSTGEETDGTSESIVEAVRKINENYQQYAENAYQHSKSFDYQVVNEIIYTTLSKYWR